MPLLDQTPGRATVLSYSSSQRDRRTKEAELRKLSGIGRV